MAPRGKAAPWPRPLPLKPRPLCTPRARSGLASSVTPSSRAGAPWRRRADMAAGSVWKGLVGLGLFALAHAAFSAAQRESPPGGRPGAPAPPHGRRGAVRAGAGPGRHHHRPQPRLRRRGRPCPWARAARRAGGSGITAGLAPCGRRSGREGRGKRRVGRGSCRPPGHGFSRASAASLPPGPTAPRLPGCLGQRRPSCPERLTLVSAAVPLGGCVAGLFVCMHGVFDACACFCFVDRSYMRLTEKEDETLPIDVSFCNV